MCEVVDDLSAWGLWLLGKAYGVDVLTENKGFMGKFAPTL